MKSFEYVIFMIISFQNARRSGERKEIKEEKKEKNEKK